MDRVAETSPTYADWKRPVVHRGPRFFSSTDHPNSAVCCSRISLPASRSLNKLAFLPRYAVCQMRREPFTRRGRSYHLTLRCLQGLACELASRLVSVLGRSYQQPFRLLVLGSGAPSFFGRGIKCRWVRSRAGLIKCSGSYLMLLKAVGTVDAVRFLARMWLVQHSGVQTHNSDDWNTATL